MVPYADLISRADNAWLQDWVHPSVIHVLQSLQQDQYRSRVLREVFLELTDPRELVSKPKTRAPLIELLRLTEANELAAALELKGDPYEALSSAAIAPKSRRHELLCSFFALPQPQVDNSEALTPEVTTAKASYTLFPHQRAAVAALLVSLGARSKRVLLHMPTGAGKTRMAMHVICRHIANASPGLAIWLANSEELCEQAAEEFLAAWKHLGNRDVSLCRFWGPRSPDLLTIKEGLIIGGFAKLYSLAKDAPNMIATLGDRASLLLIDEAHQAIAPTYRLLIDGLCARHAAMPVLGLTATPGRTWNDPEIDRQLADYFSRNKVTLRVPGFDNPIDFLVSEGYLAAPTFRQISHPSDRLTPQDLEALAKDLDIPKTVLQKLATDERRTVKIVRDVEDLAKRHHRILLFATTVEHAIILAAVLQARGIEARAITASTPGAKRSAAITWFKQNSDAPRVLTNYGVLTTGFDAPKTSAAVIARPTKSLVLYSQMVGRAIRGPKAGGNESAEIVTVVDTSLPGFGTLSSAFTNWEDVW